MSVVLTALAAATAATATDPKPGASFKGKLAEPRDNITITFKVSKNGKRVTRLRLSDMPSYCRSGGKPEPMKFKRTRISRMGTFRAVNLKHFGSGERQGEMRVRVKVTGRFIAKNVVKGRVTTNWTAAADPDLCDGGDSYMAGAR